MLIALSVASLLASGQAATAPDNAPEHRIHFVSQGPGMDKDGDGFVSREEFMAPLDRAFADMDKDGDGRLSGDERADDHGPGHHRIEWRGAPGERHVEIIRAGDGPRHGGPRIMLRERADDAARDGEEREIVIVRADGEGDAQVTVNGRVVEGDDRNVIVRRLGPGGPGERFSFSRREDGPGDREHVMVVRAAGGPDGDLDKDGDGKVSEEEFIAPMRDAFRQMDADRSGALEEGEHGRGRD